MPSLKALFTSLLAAHSTTAYIIDAICSADKVAKIDAAVAEALVLAEYGSWRLNNDQANVDTFRTQTIGSSPNAVDSYTKRMNGLSSVVGTKTTAPFTGKKDRALDSTILFRCGDNAAVDKNSDPSSNRWVDEAFKGRFASEPYGPNGRAVCEDGVKALTAFTKPKTGETMPTAIIYLCEAAFTDDDGNDLPVTIGTEWKTKAWTGKPVERTAKYLSGTILHELLHAQNAQKIAGLVSLDGSLPSGQLEQYSWSKISGSSDDDKIANDHGYVLLTTAMYMKAFKIKDNGKMGDSLAPDQQAGNSPNDGHQN